MHYKVSNTQLKAISKRLDLSARSGDFKVFRRCQALTLIFKNNMDFFSIGGLLKVSGETVRIWLKEFLTVGVRSLSLKIFSGRKAKLTHEQFEILREYLQFPPYESGFGYTSGCWNAALIQNLIKRLFQVRYAVKYLPELLRRIGFSYQKAKFQAAKSDPKKRDEWIKKTWPEILKKAKKERAMILFGDEASFALWGSLGYTWSPIGKQPEVFTNGNRKNLKVFGAIDFFTGRLFSQQIVGSLNGDSYIKFLREILKKADQKVILVQDGASYHRSRQVKEFVQDHDQKISTFQLPAYSPDFNPIESLWRRIKRDATHNVFFESFDQLKKIVQKQLAKTKRNPAKVLSLFGLYHAL